MLLSTLVCSMLRQHFNVRSRHDCGHVRATCHNASVYRSFEVALQFPFGPITVDLAVSFGYSIAPLAAVSS